MSDLERLQSLTDKHAISEVIYRYCRSVDRLDIPLGHTVWHEDGIADYGDVYCGPGRGVIDLICAQHLYTLYHSHQMSNILIELNGDRAGSESYVTANLRIQQGDALKQMTVWSRYVDTWSRRDGIWAIDKRIAVRDFDEIRDVVPLGTVVSEGRRDHSDTSYTTLPASGV